MGRLDVDGWLFNRSTIDPLGWTASDCLNIALVGGSVVGHRDPTGVFAMGTKPYFVLPTAHRRLPTRRCCWPGRRHRPVAAVDVGVAVLEPRLVLGLYGGFLRASIPRFRTTYDPEVIEGRAQAPGRGSAPSIRSTSSSRYSRTA